MSRWPFTRPRGPPLADNMLMLSLSYRDKRCNCTLGCTYRSLPFWMMRQWPL